MYTFYTVTKQQKEQFYWDVTVQRRGQLDTCSQVSCNKRHSHYLPLDYLPPPCILHSLVNTVAVSKFCTMKMDWYEMQTILSLAQRRPKIHLHKGPFYTDPFENEGPGKTEICICRSSSHGFPEVLISFFAARNVMFERLVDKPLGIIQIKISFKGKIFPLPLP